MGTVGGSIFGGRPLWVLLAVMSVLLSSMAVQAAPLRNVPVEVKQPDGSVLKLLASGDEFYNWVHDERNFTIVRDPKSGYAEYAVLESGELVPSGHRVGIADPVSVGLAPGTNIPPEKMAALREAFLQTPKTDGLSPAPKTGAINNVVVFIRFSDEAEFADASSLYDSAFNTSVASMDRYFREVSYNALAIPSTFYPIPLGATVASYQDAYPRSYYEPYDAATNPDGYTGSNTRIAREHALLANAVDAISASVPSDLILDGDGDGNVDSVCFVVRGEPTAWSTLLWPHKTSLSSQTVYINSERVYSYNLQLQSVFTVGVLCHEMFHLLGAPDLYHYYYDLSPVGPWDLMEWNLDPPQHMAAYMKYRYGNWIGSIPEITVPGTYILNPLTSAVDNCYKIRSRTPSQYFVVEYRREASSVFEDSLPGTGLLVYRIDTARDGYGNPWGPPDEVYVYRPGGTPTTDGDLSSACFSSSAGRVAISDTTDPAGFLADGAPGGLDISDVSAASGTISFNVRRLPGTASGVYSSGYNSFGQLGVGDSINRIYPTQVPTPSAVTAIAGGAQHSLILMGNGDVYAAGNGEHGQLGNGSTSRRFTPIRIESLSGVKSIACGDWHSLVLTESGDVYAFGYNRYGQLGLVDSQNRTSPTKIPTLAGAKAIAAGQYHSLVLLENGDVYSFGSSSYGQLGLGDTENHGAPTKIPNLSAAKAIAAGGDHSLVLLENGDVYSFGYNGNGELGLGDRGVSAYRVVPEKIPDFSGVKIAAGCRHSLALSENGEVYAFGDNGSGQLGLGDTEERNSPTRIPTLSGAKAIAGGGYYSFVLMESRETYAFGYNLTGELGLGDRSNRMYPTQIPALSGATLIACGGNHSIVALVCSSPPPPSAPSATDGMYSDKVHVGWTEVPDAARYEVWRAVSADGVYTNVGELESHAFDDTTVTDGQTYWYRVRACNDCGRSDFSPADSGYAGVLQNTPAAFRVTGQGSVQADGVFYSSGFNTGAADVAEWVSVSEPVEAGTVLELDTSQPGWYRRSHTPCSTLVAGVVSSQPGMVLGGPDGPIEGMALLALTGIVPVKVTDEGGPIQPGDLLVSSSTPGYAMRWAGPDPCPCALVGKALEPMTDERGVISVLLTAH